MQELTLSVLPVTLTTHSPEETEAVGAALARLLEGDKSCPTFIAMYGDLGVGKTAFVRGLASVMAPGRGVRSPTFSLVNEYRVAGKKPLFHFDMYRIEDGKLAEHWDCVMHDIGAMECVHENGQF